MPAPVFSIPFQLADGLILIEGEANGKTGFWVFDTGADCMVINTARIAFSGRSLGTATVGDSHGGSTKQQVIQVANLRWGSIRLKDVGAVAVNLQSMELGLELRVPQSLKEQPLLGILGVPQMEPFLTIFDYGAQQLLLVSLDKVGNPLAPIPGAIPAVHVPLTMRGNTPLVQVTMGDSTHTVVQLLELDSGNDGAVKLNAGLIQQLGVRVQDGSSVSRTLSGDGTRMKEGILNHLTVGTVEYGKIDVATTTTSESYSTGELGYSFFKMKRLGLNFRKPTLLIWDTP